MRVTPASPILLLTTLTTLSAVNAAQTHDINVGKGGLVYHPDTVTASSGDTLRFHFYGPEHNVAQGTQDSPCQPAPNAIFSGDMPVSGSGPGNKVFDVVVNDTKPLWFYCAVEDHCPSGMAMVVNSASKGDLAKYKSSAVAAEVKEPGSVSGGIIANANSGNSGSGTSSAGATSSASATGSGAASGTATTAPASSGAGSGSATASASAATATHSGAAAGVINPASAGWLIGMGLGGAVIGGLVN